MTKLTKSTARFFLIVGMMLGIFLGIVSTHTIYKLRPEPEPVTIVETVTFPVPTVIYGREEIGGQVDEYRKTGDLDIIADFYNNFVDNMEITYLILSAAQMYDIPENVLFALIWAESDFQPGAYNGKNNNGTNDKGLMQLNSRYFKGFDRTNPRLNLVHGCKHLRSRYEKYGTWDEAVMYYNGFSQQAVAHQARVLMIERRLDSNINYLFFDKYTQGAGL